MSVTINIYYSGDGDSAVQFVREMEESGTAQKVRQEEGNLRYEYFIPYLSPNTAMLVESWADRESLEAHGKTPMMETIKALKVKYGLQTKAETFVGPESPD